MENKSILVTGGLGFIGSHFVELLYKRCNNCIIDIVDIKDYCVSKRTEDLLFDEGRESGNDVSIIYHDIETWTLDTEYDYIVNFAAQSHVDRSISSGDEFVKTNVNGMYNLLKQVSAKTRFIQIGTDEVYGSLDINDVPSEEAHTLFPSSVYSSTKAAADLIALSMHKTHGTNVIVTRCCNNFGPRQYPEKLIPVVVKSILSDKKIPVYGNGANRRQWIFVKDHCEQVFDIMLYGEAGEIYNIAPSYRDWDHLVIPNELTNLNIIYKIIEILTKEEPSNLIEYVEDRKGHDLRYRLNGSKTRFMIDRSRQHQPELPHIHKTFEKDLEYTIMWYKDNQRWWENENSTD
ncbi:NAD-dependent epimerase/dehydratase family protein [archaeon]|nr:NAD-dependent epimerase/dehydratase family protein [archaeon]